MTENRRLIRVHHAHFSRYRTETRENRNNMGLENLLKIPLSLHFMLPNFIFMQKKSCTFRKYRKLKIDHFDPELIFSALAQNLPVRLFGGSVVHGHKCKTKY